jgi:hypothetical protein
VRVPCAPRVLARACRASVRASAVGGSAVQSWQSAAAQAVRASCAPQA